MNNIPLNAQAIMALDKNKSARKTFDSLPENLKWEWTLYSCSHTAKESLKYIEILQLRTKD